MRGLSYFSICVAVVFLLLLYCVGFAGEKKVASSPSPVQTAEKTSPSEDDLSQLPFISVPQPTYSAQPSEQAVSGEDSGADWLKEAEQGSRADKLREKKFTKRVFQTILALIVVGVLIFFTIRFLSKTNLNLSFLGIGPQSSKIKVVDRQLLQPNKILYLIKVAEKCVLIGVCENSINYLTEVDASGLDVTPAENTAVEVKNKSAFDMFAKVDVNKSSDK